MTKPKSVSEGNCCRNWP